MIKPIHILAAAAVLTMMSAPVSAKPPPFANPVASCDWTNPGGHDVRPPGLCGDGNGEEEYFSPGVDTATIPEPSTLALLLAGGMSVAVRKWRDRRSQ